MFGTIVFENPSNFYAEYLLVDENGCLVIACIASGLIRLYRVEWMEDDGTPAHTAVYTLLSAIALFQEKSLVAAEAAADAQEQSYTPLIVFVEGSITHTAENGYECDELDCICHL